MRAVWAIELAPLGEDSLYACEEGNWRELVDAGVENRTGQARNCARLVSNAAQTWAVERRWPILKVKADGTSAIVQAQTDAGVLEVWYSYEPEKKRAVAEIWVIDPKGNQLEPAARDGGLGMLKETLRVALECAH